MDKASKFELKLVRKEKVSRDAYTFYFDRSKLNFDFIPGQYIKIFLDIDNPDERGSSRYFTISSSPNEKNFLTITTRIIKSSFKHKLNNLKSGEIVRAFGPVGYFDYNCKINNPAIFIAGGIGVTPFRSLIKYLISINKKPEITLFNFFQKKEDSVFYEEFKNIEKGNPNIRVIYSLTKEKFEGFEFGRITSELIKKNSSDYINSSYFIVGPQEMVLSTFDIVSKMGISEDKIFKEDFTGY